MAGLSKKKTQQNKELTEVYREMDVSAIHDDSFYCSGCGRGGVPLDHSHILSRKQHPDLITVRENIVYDCKSMGGKGCHDKWEDKYPEELITLKNLEYRLEIVMKYDTKLFYELIDKLDNYASSKQNSNIPT